MKKVGQLSVGKQGFDIGLGNDAVKDLHGNYDLYIRSESNPVNVDIQVIDYIKNIQQDLNELATTQELKVLASQLDIAVDYLSSKDKSKSGGRCNYIQVRTGLTSPG